jgi:hypothetical protein
MPIARSVQSRIAPAPWNGAGFCNRHSRIRLTPGCGNPDLHIYADKR